MKHIYGIRHDFAIPTLYCLQVWAPHPKHQMNGITRQKVLALCRREGIPCRELDFTLTQVKGPCNAAAEWLCVPAMMAGCLRSEWRCRHSGCRPAAGRH